MKYDPCIRKTSEHEEWVNVDISESSRFLVVHFTDFLSFSRQVPLTY